MQTQTEATTVKVTAERFGNADCVRMVVSVGLAVRMANNEWMASTSNDKTFGFRRPNANAVARDFISMAKTTRCTEAVEAVEAALTSVAA